MAEDIRELIREANHSLTGEQILDLMVKVWRYFQGRTFEEAIDLIEEVTGETLLHRRCDKCPECGSSINVGRTCSNWSCENKEKKLTPEECIKDSKESVLWKNAGKEAVG